METLSKLQRLDSFMKESQRLNASSFRKFCVCCTLTANYRIPGADVVSQSDSIAK